MKTSKKKLKKKTKLFFLKRRSYLLEATVPSGVPMVAFWDSLHARARRLLPPCAHPSHTQQQGLGLGSGWFVQQDGAGLGAKRSAAGTVPESALSSGRSPSSSRCGSGTQFPAEPPHKLHLELTGPPPPAWVPEGRNAFRHWEHPPGPSPERREVNFSTSHSTAG